MGREKSKLLLVCVIKMDQKKEEFILKINLKNICDDPLIRNGRISLHLKEVAHDIQKINSSSVNGDIFDVYGRVVGHYEVS